MATVLLYNIKKEKAAKLKMLCRSFFMEAKDVEKADYGKTLSFLLGESDDPHSESGADFDDEMLYLADVNPSLLGVFLDQLKRKKLTVALKAVNTETNAGFSSYRLRDELCAEREAMSQGKTAH